MFVILFGAPGVGKGTQAKILSTKFNLRHISTGDILREAVKKGTVLGIKASEIMKSGQLVPDDIMIGIINESISDKDIDTGFILDGFPRTVSQAEALESFFTERNITGGVIIVLEANEDALILRITHRVACKECNSIFNTDLLKDVNNCPECGAVNSLYQRQDDKEEIINNRMEIFRETTLPVLSYYNEQRPVCKINGLQTIEKVAEDIITALKEAKLIPATV